MTRSAIIDFNRIVHSLEMELAGILPAAAHSMPYDDAVDYYVNCVIHGELFERIIVNALTQCLKEMSVPTSIVENLDKATKELVSKRINENFDIGKVTGHLSVTRMAAYQYLIEEVTDTEPVDEIFYLDEDENYAEGCYNPTRTGRSVRSDAE